MSVRESSFNRKFRTEMGLRGFKIDRIESHATIPGLPDDAFLHEFTLLSGWIEIKEEETIPSKVKYRPRQALWLETHTALGGCAMTLIHIKKSNEAILIPGKHSFVAEKDLKGLLARPSTGVRTINLTKLVPGAGNFYNGWDALTEAILTTSRIAQQDKKEAKCLTHKT
jgi:hypothetical protein